MKQAQQNQLSKLPKLQKKIILYFIQMQFRQYGNVEIDVDKMGIDMLSLSGHKIYGPKGVGALYVRKGIEFEKFMNGGGQEKNKRAGTENVAGIVGLGKACELSNRNLKNHIQKVKALRDYLLDRLTHEFPNIKINGSLEKRLPRQSKCFI